MHLQHLYMIVPSYQVLQGLSLTLGCWQLGAYICLREKYNGSHPCWDAVSHFASAWGTCEFHSCRSSKNLEMLMDKAIGSFLSWSLIWVEECTNRKVCHCLSYQTYFLTSSPHSFLSPYISSEVTALLLRANELLILCIFFPIEECSLFQFFFLMT